MPRRLSRSSSTHVAVTAKVLQQFDLAQSSLGEDLLAEDICHLLDGDTLAGLVVLGGTGRAVSEPAEKDGAMDETYTTTP